MDSYSKKREELENRTVAFGVNVIKTCGEYANNPRLRPVYNQVIRSATSIGANYAEANNASSRADFKNKIFISKKEAAETRFWLKILSSFAPPGSLDELVVEARELNLILQKIISTMKAGDNDK
jgi:four helix bundle protein